MRALRGVDGVLHGLVAADAVLGADCRACCWCVSAEVSGCGGRTCGAALVEAFLNGGVVFLSFVGLASTTVCRRERRRGVQKQFLQACDGDARASEVEAFWDCGCGAWTPQFVAVALPGAQVRAWGQESQIASLNERTTAALFEALLVWAGVAKHAGATQNLSTSVAAARALWAAGNCVLLAGSGGRGASEVDACCVSGHTCDKRRRAVWRLRRAFLQCRQDVPSIFDPQSAPSRVTLCSAKAARDAPCCLHGLTR